MRVCVPFTSVCVCLYFGGIGGTTHVAFPAGGHIARGRRCGALLKDELPDPGRPVWCAPAR